MPRSTSCSRPVARLGSARIDEPGAILVDQLDALLGERMPASPSFCVLATSAEGVEVVLCGEVEVTVARGGQVSRHAGPDPDTWVDLLVDEGFDWLVAVPLGSAEPPSDVRLDLHDGVVPGGGLRLTQRDRLPGESRPRRADGRRSEPAADGADAAPRPRPGAEPGCGAGGGFVSVPLWRAPVRRSTRRCPVATTSLDEPVPEPDAVLVPTLRCSAGHPNNPAASHCASLRPVAARRHRSSRRTSAALARDCCCSTTDRAYTLDAGYLIGSHPDLAISLSRGDVRPLVLPEAGRCRCRRTPRSCSTDGPSPWPIAHSTRTRGCAVQVTANGRASRTSRPEAIVAESQIRIGERVLTFVAARRISGDEPPR